MIPSGRLDDIEQAGFVLTDTNGDGQPDSFLPGTSNFAAGFPSDPLVDFWFEEHCDDPPNCNHSRGVGPATAVQ